MGSTTNTVVCVSIFMMIAMMSSLPSTHAQSFPTSWKVPLDNTTRRTVDELETEFPKKTLNNTNIVYYCNDSVITGGPITMADGTIQTLGGHVNAIPDIYSIRTGFPAICVMFWAQLRNDMPVNASSTILYNTENYPGFRLWKMIFYAQVDLFSLLEAYRSNWYYTISHVAVQVPGIERSDWIELQHLKKDTRVVDDRVSATNPVNPFVFVVPFVTLIVQLNGGYPVSLTWDSGCYGCDSRLTATVQTESACVGDMNHNSNVTNQFCGDLSRITGTDTTGYGLPTAANQDTTASLKIYIGWFGTDRYSKYLTSADKRFSQFRQYSIASVYRSAANSVSQQAPSFPSLPIDNFRT